MHRTLRNRIQDWVTSIPWRYTMWLATRRQHRDRAARARDYQ